MKIEDIIRLWSGSNHNSLIICGFPYLNSNKDIIYDSNIYTKGETITCGKEYSVEDYLKKMYKGSIFMLDSVDEYYLTFKMIMKGNVESENNNI